LIITKGMVMVKRTQSLVTIESFAVMMGGDAQLADAHLRLVMQNSLATGKCTQSVVRKKS